MDQEKNILAMRIQGSVMFVNMESKAGFLVVKDYNQFELEELEEELEAFQEKINGVMQTFQSLL